MRCNSVTTHHPGTFRSMSVVPSAPPFHLKHTHKQRIPSLSACILNLDNAPAAFEHPPYCCSRCMGMRAGSSRIPLFHSHNIQAYVGVHTPDSCGFLERAAIYLCVPYDFPDYKRTRRRRRRTRALCFTFHQPESTELHGGISTKVKTSGLSLWGLKISFWCPSTAVCTCT